MIGSNRNPQDIGSFDIVFFVNDSLAEDANLNPAPVVVFDLGAPQNTFIAFVISRKENGQWLATPLSTKLLEYEFHSDLVAWSWNRLSIDWSDRLRIYYNLPRSSKKVSNPAQ